MSVMSVSCAVMALVKLGGWVVDNAGMEYDDKISFTLAELIAGVNPGMLLGQDRETPREWLASLEPGLFPKNTSPADVLGHLLVLSHSGLVCPQANIDALRTVLSDVPASMPNDPDYNPFAYFCYKSLPKLLPDYFLTIKGYQFLAGGKKRFDDDK